MAQLKDKAVGDIVNIGGTNYLVLSQVNSTSTKLIAQQPLFEKVFDSNVNNRLYDQNITSNIAYHLNNTWIQTLPQFIIDAIKQSTWKTTSVSSLNQYVSDANSEVANSVTAKIGLPSLDDYRVLRDLENTLFSPTHEYTLNPRYQSYGRMIVITSAGQLADFQLTNSRWIRPAFVIDSSLLVSDNGEVTSNANPAITVTSPSDARTLYENDILNVAGTVTDTDAGNVVSVKYSINGGAARAIIGSVSQGSAIAFAKNLTYKAGKLYDGATAITATLAEGSQHNIRIWAEDDQGGKSSEITRSFYVVPNRAATLTLDAFVTRTGLINTDVVNITGKVSDLDNGNVIVKYKIGNSAYTQVFNGTIGSTPTAFNFNIALSQLAEGQNTITIQAVDAYGAITQQVLTLKKDKTETPLKTAVTYYQITPPNGTADGLQLFIERETGDLAVAVDVFMGANTGAETFVPMTMAGTANLTNGNVEETFSYQHGTDAAKIVVRITMTRTGTATNKAIKKVSGVLT